MKAQTAPTLPALPDLPELRAIPTRDADLFVPWTARCVRQVLRQRGITADDFDTRTPSLKAFVRDLAPLAAQDALAGVRDGRLSHLLRALFLRLHGEAGPTHDGAAPVPSHG